MPNVSHLNIGGVAYDLAPTAPVTVGNGQLTIQKNGVDVQTFTANQSADATANITVPTKVSELTNDSGYTTNTGTVTQVKVGTTGYDPSSGVVSLPAYPTVNNGTLTIQKNGSNVATFTANQSGNATANIGVPTKTSDLTNDSIKQWANHGSVTGATYKSFPSSYTDLIIEVKIPYTGFNIEINFALTKAQLSSTGKYFDGGADTSTFVRIYVTNTGVTLNTAVAAGASYLTSAVTTVYYR